MAEIYNEQVLEVANSLRSKLNAIIDTVNAIRRFGPKFKDEEKTQMVTEVKSLAQEFGHTLTDWQGNDRSVEEPVEEI